MKLERENMFTQKFEACLLVVQYLNDKEHKKMDDIQIYLLQNGLDFQQAYITRMVADLKRSGIVKTRRGGAGGYRIEKCRITALDIYESVQGGITECSENTKELAKTIKTALKSMIVKYGY